jgi:ABC-type amino acid transport substrate-binding protein
MIETLKRGTLIVASAYPDPPFDVPENGGAGGFDAELMRAICDRLKFTLQPVRYEGADFNGIFEGLSSARYDAVISGTTITPERLQMALRRICTYAMQSTGHCTNSRAPDSSAYYAPAGTCS